MTLSTPVVWPASSTRLMRPALQRDAATSPFAPWPTLRLPQLGGPRARRDGVNLRSTAPDAASVAPGLVGDGLVLALHRAPKLERHQKVNEVNQQGKVVSMGAPARRRCSNFSLQRASSAVEAVLGNVRHSADTTAASPRWRPTGLSTPVVCHAASGDDFVTLGRVGMLPRPSPPNGLLRPRRPGTSAANLNVSFGPSRCGPVRADCFSSHHLADWIAPGSRDGAV
jgi:hypothetical protein